MSDILLEARNLRYETPDGKSLFENLSFSLKSGSLLLVTGANGSGKSTLLNILRRQLKPTSGTLNIPVPPNRVAILSQLQNSEFHLPLTLKDVLEVMLGRKVGVFEVEKFGLINEKQLCLSWNTASGGERKRILLTRILMESPSIILLDEPMNHLDPESRARVLDVIGAFLRDHIKSCPRGVVLVSHESHGATFGLDPKHLSSVRLGEEVSEVLFR